MVSVSIAVEESFKERVESFAWVTWSEVAREEAIKKEIFEKFIKTGTLSADDQEFCDEIDWYPVDELPLKEEYVKKLKKLSKEPAGKPMTIEELDKLLGVK